MSGVIDPRVVLENASLLAQAGRLAEAEVAYLSVLSRWPDLPDTWYNLARLQRRAGRFDAALDSYQQALDRGVEQPEEVHLNRGVIYSDCLRQEAAAERELNAALALNAHYAPALLNLANLKEDLGERDAACELYRRLLVLEPQHYEALARYASLQTVERADDPLIARLRAALNAQDASRTDRASLGFALGKTLDDCGAYDDAFAAYVAANSASRASAGASVLYDRAQHERFVDCVIAAFPSERVIEDTASAPARPIFVCGMFRSGSTLIEQVLAAHPRVVAGGELALLPSLVRTELAPFPASMASLSRAQIEQLTARYEAMLSTLFPGAERVTDKRPDNFLYVGLIKTLFPNARIIHTRRNALDNCLSVFFLHLDHSMSYALDLLDAAHYLKEHDRLMAHWRALYGADIFDVDYDALVQAPQPIIEQMLSFCGLEWEERCLSFHHVRNAVKTASVWQVRQPLYQGSSGRWRKYARHLGELRKYLDGAI